MDLVTLSGSTAQDPSIQTTPLQDGYKRSAAALVLTVIISIAAERAGLSDEERASLLLIVPSLVLLIGAAWDKLIAPRLLT